MKISLRTIGDLRDYFGREPAEIVLADNAIMEDLLSEIDSRWGLILPNYLWNRQEKRFRGGVVLMTNKTVIRDLKSPLQDGIEIQIMRAIAGG